MWRTMSRIKAEDTHMLHTSDVLRAHAQCKQRLAELLDAKRLHDPYFCELAPDQECLVVRFMRENAGDEALEPELTHLRTAHAEMHCAAIALAQKRSAGQVIDIAHEFGSNGELGMASSELIDNIWRIERKLEQMTPCAA
ncbi:hypothetical protein GCM10008942_26800 [Rhizomicrobium electricum]|jgi:hypothetical protein|uniref:Hemerythrin-like domain-containing protein n=2 Tax=Rhizomicrobium electricum TaxID=480070 RepID=A0ABN1EWZ4_9PROT